MKTVLRRVLAIGWLPLLLSAPAQALEKTSARVLERSPGNLWALSSTVTIRYYNHCTGWVWTWTDFEPGDQLGVHYTLPISHAVLTTSWHLVFSPAPSGYGFTGTIALLTAVSGCPVEPPLASHPFLPVSGWNAVPWGNSVPTNFVLRITTGPTADNGTGYTSDHPAAGPTGPIPCGACYPSTRVTRSVLYGTAAQPRCPGTKLFDGSCDAEWMWEAALKSATSVEEDSWGSIKALYR